MRYKNYLHQLQLLKQQALSLEQKISQIQEAVLSEMASLED
jgi:hypothetical protein